ncbi:hypothetical protein [Streptomyces sp. NBC_01750]|uniref:hypothetical protein n=1 Tax=Streptomyces sp. NBC_01750 TaxID=2975928 RepID=UPI002DDA76A3|nr:hypothetical protein [Streptomyces sp. NBC_01750]WSD38097.1 hypothetical protein OG966_40315 [Streptomyces sp. NBC_01750]
MQIDGAQERPGTALLLAAAPTGKGKLTEASSVIPVLAAVPPAALAGTAAATLIELADPVDPQAVLTRLRGAAATEGPLTVVLVGQLQLDCRQQGVHLALARTTPSTIRYTALPWAWLVAELQQRRPDTTTLYVDLVAAAEVWQLLDDEPLPLPGGARTYGVIAPPPGRRRIAHPRYTHALAQILRTGQRSAPDQLHHEALRRAAVKDALVLGPEQPAAAVNATLPPGSSAARVQLPPPPPRAQRTVSPVYQPSAAVIPVEHDPHEQIAALAKAGRHQEAVAMAAAAEQRAVQTFGADTFAALHWVEVRAHLASVAQDPGQSCLLWLQAAQTRLDTLQQAPDAPDLEGAVDRAHHQWDRVRDAAYARRLAPQLVAFRRRVPGRQRGALQVLQKKLERLQSA